MNCLLFYALLTLTSIGKEVIITFAQDCQGTSTFVITIGHSSNPQIFVKYSVNSLKQCIEKCTQYGVKCKAVNLYLTDQQSTIFECNLLEAIGIDASMSRNIENRIIPSNKVNITSPHFRFDTTAGKLYAEKICLPKAEACSTIPWSFELVPNTEIMTEKLANFILKEDTWKSNEECLWQCLQFAECQTVQIDRRHRTCKYLSITRHTVRNYERSNYLRTDPQDVYLYENNCYTKKVSSNMNEMDCKFLTRKSDKMQQVYNNIVDSKGTNDLSQCQKLCTNAGSMLCRSFTFDTSKKMCYLSHVSYTRSTSQEDASFSDNFVHGELDDCIGLGLECGANKMSIFGTTMKLFNGTFGVKSATLNDNKCYGHVIDKLDFSFEINYNTCGTILENGTVYTNVLQLKDGFTSLITYRDRLAKLICRTNQGPFNDIPVTVQLQVSSNTTAEIQFLKNDKPTRIQPSYYLKVLNSQMDQVNTVRLGEYGYLEVGFENSATGGGDHSKLFKMQVSNVVAKDIKDGKEFNLFDNAGCPVNPEFAGNFEYTPSGTLRSKVKFFGFSETSKVYYKGEVRPCLNDCSSLKNCQLKKTLTKRAKRHFRNGANEKYTLKSDLIWQKPATVIPLIDETWLDDETKFQEKLLSSYDVKVFQTDFLESKISSNSNLDESKFFNNSHSSKFSTAKNSSTKCIDKNSYCLITVLLVICQIITLAFCACAIYGYCILFCKDKPTPNSSLLVKPEEYHQAETGTVNKFQHSMT